MESRIPIPTDNIYKFYAFFGLLVVISSMLAVVYVSSSTNKNVYELVKEYEKLNKSGGNEKSQLVKILEKRIEIAGKNKKFYEYVLGIAIGVEKNLGQNTVFANILNQIIYWLTFLNMGLLGADHDYRFYKYS